MNWRNWSTHVTADNVATWLPLAKLAENNDETEVTFYYYACIAALHRRLRKRICFTLSRPAFVRDIDGLFEAADFSEELRESMFAQYGETGVDVYADFLVERERFDEWAALMHRYGVSYDGAEAGGLKLALSCRSISCLAASSYVCNGLSLKKRTVTVIDVPSNCLNK